MMKEVIIGITGAILILLVAMGFFVFMFVVLFPLIDHWQEAFQAYLNTK